jgi:hypothetical protein
MTLAIASSVLAVGGCGRDDSSSSATTTQTGAASVTVPTETDDENTGTIESFDRMNYDVLVTDPDAHKGARVTIVGKVFSDVERDADGTYFQMWADPQNSEWNTIVGSRDPELAIAADDFVRISGEVVGAYEGENALGGTVQAVRILATSVTKVDATAAAPPALKTLPKKRARSNGIILTVQRVEFAENETRVFLALKNNSSSEFTMYSSSGKAVSGGRQYESDYGGDYPQLSDSVLPRAFTTGVVVFPRMDPDKPLRLRFEGSSDNYDIGNFGTLDFEFNW